MSLVTKIRSLSEPNFDHIKIRDIILRFNDIALNQETKILKECLPFNFYPIYLASLPKGERIPKEIMLLYNAQYRKVIRNDKIIKELEGHMQIYDEFIFEFKNHMRQKVLLSAVANVNNEFGQMCRNIEAILEDLFGMSQGYIQTLIEDCFQHGEFFGKWFLLDLIIRIRTHIVADCVQPQTLFMRILEKFIDEPLRVYSKIVTFCITAIEHMCKFQKIPNYPIIDQAKNQLAQLETELTEPMRKLTDYAQNVFWKCPEKLVRYTLIKKFEQLHPLKDNMPLVYWDYLARFTLEDYALMYRLYQPGKSFDDLWADEN